MSQSLPPKIKIAHQVDHESSSGSEKELTGDDSVMHPDASLLEARGKNESMSSGGKLDRKESYKAQRRNYRKEKKRVAKELLCTFKDESVIVLADWLKIRGSLKGWTKLWCVLKPGLLILYRSQKAKSSHWIGTIILSSAELIERPSKKDGFCFKLFHPMDQSIWAARGPEGENIGAVVQPLPTSYLIFRAPHNSAGKCWMDALELALRCSSLLVRNKSSRHSQVMDGEYVDGVVEKDVDVLMNDSDMEKHFKADLEDGGSVTDEGEIAGGATEVSTFPSDEEDDSEAGSDGDSVMEDPAELPPHTNYVCDQSEVFGTTTDQTEEFSDENKSIVWFLVKQVRPGMDLSRVVLPTFILEPRSFLDKLSDYFYHADILSKAVAEDEPFMRMKTIVKWYLSGFYKKPKGLKKPYNPILGETFRCYWEHPTGSKTFYIGEQVSHHPPISAYYITNRQDGFTLASSILAKSKFYGNSTSAILEGSATLSLLPRGEEYKMTMPYAHCKGILMGTMTMELGGKVSIECERTGYKTELEFKLRPFLGGGDLTNGVSGRLKLGNETLMMIDGHWDGTVKMTDKKTGQEEVLWQVSPEMKQARLKRFCVPIEEQTEWESARLWKHVSAAIEAEDQVAATDQKTVLEQAQRAALKDRTELGTEWHRKYFDLESGYSYAAMEGGRWTYKHADFRPWDPRNDMFQYEHNYILCTKTRHKTPMIRTQSIVSVIDAAKPPGERVANVARRRKTREESVKARTQDSDTSVGHVGIEKNARPCTSSSVGEELSGSSLQAALQPLVQEQRLMSDRIGKLHHSIETCLYNQKERDSNTNLNRDMVLLVILVVMIQAVLNWVLTERARQNSQ